MYCKPSYIFKEFNLFIFLSFTYYTNKLDAPLIIIFQLQSQILFNKYNLYTDSKALYQSLHLSLFSVSYIFNHPWKAVWYSDVAWKNGRTWAHPSGVLELLVTVTKFISVYHASLLLKMRKHSSELCDSLIKSAVWNPSFI